MNEEFRQQVIETLRRGEDLPPDWARVLFPPEKREYELTYFGKERQEDVIAETMAVPLQPVSTFGKNGNGWHNKLIFGDNLQVMKTLLRMKEEGQLTNADGTSGIRLVYIDPPFATRREFSGSQEQKAYQDKIVGAEFLEFVRKRLILLRELLSSNGALYVHLDNRRAQYIKVLLDEVFLEGNFRNAIVWKRSDAHSDVSQGATHFGRVYDTIFYYVRGEQTKVNPVYTPLPQTTVDKWYRHVEEGTKRRYNMADASGPGGARKGNPYFEWNGVKRYWRYSQESMARLEKEGKLVYSSTGVAYVKRYLDESKGVSIQDWWDDIPMLRGIHQNDEGASYPTQKPEHLLDRIIRSSSNEGDIVLDAFAGSGTTCAVAEKHGRRWIGIDCGKLAVYTIQKRMLTLKSQIGNTGEQLKAKPFTVYNAGLYDFSTLKQLPWKDWRFFGLQLFNCKDEPHKIGGMQLDGKLKGSSVLVFNHREFPDKRIDEDTIHDIHTDIGKKVGHRFFIIAPRGVFDFQQDYVTFDNVRYYALRIPYSVINELHHKEFTALQQPSDETAVNETVDAVGFDFIQPPTVEWEATIGKREEILFEEACLHINKFESRARIRGTDSRGGLETFSMLMLDFDYNGEVFDFDAIYFAHDLQEEGWQARFPDTVLGEKTMAVFIDIYGNEARELIPREKFERQPEAQAKPDRSTKARRKPRK